jgi:hypothetical protein
LSFPSCVAKYQVGEVDDVLRWSQAVIDIADGETARGIIILGSPLAMHLAFRGVARWNMGLPGWREDIREAIAMSRASDAVTHSAVIGYSYLAIPAGVMLADETALDVIDTAMQLAEKSSEDIALVLIRMTLGLALVESQTRDVDRGYEILAQLREMCIKERYAMNIIAPLELYAGHMMLAQGDADEAVSCARSGLDEMFRSENFGNSAPGTNTFVETLLARRAVGDLTDAEVAIERLAGTLPEQRSAIRDIYVLRLRALLANARGDDAYRDLRDGYRAMAIDLGFEGHMKWAAEMP